MTGDLLKAKKRWYKTARQTTREAVWIYQAIKSRRGVPTAIWCENHMNAGPKVYTKSQDGTSMLFKGHSRVLSREK